jgi:hypothetical protein
MIRTGTPTVGGLDESYLKFKSFQEPSKSSENIQIVFLLVNPQTLPLLPQKFLDAMLVVNPFPLAKVREIHEGKSMHLLFCERRRKLIHGSSALATELRLSQLKLRAVRVALPSGPYRT